MKKRYQILTVVIGAVLLLGGCASADQSQKAGADQAQEETLTSQDASEEGKDQGDTSSESASTETSKGNVTEGFDTEKSGSEKDNGIALAFSAQMTDYYCYPDADEITLKQTEDFYTLSTSGEWQPRLLLHAEWQTVDITGIGADAAEQIRSWSEKAAETIRSEAEENAGLAMEDEQVVETAAADAIFYSYEQSYETKRTDSRVISIESLLYSYTGGVHGYPAYYGYSFDTQTGKLLELSDVVTDMDGFAVAADAAICDQLYGEYAAMLYSDYEDLVAEIWTEEYGGPDWYMGDDGLYIVFNAYELGPYAMGKVEARLSYDDFSEYLNAAYLPEE